MIRFELDRSGLDQLFLKSPPPLRLLGQGITRRPATCHPEAEPAAGSAPPLLSVLRASVAKTKRNLRPSAQIRGKGVVLLPSRNPSPSLA
jgi:hypothetical protein